MKNQKSILIKSFRALNFFFLPVILGCLFEVIIVRHIEKSAHMSPLGVAVLVILFLARIYFYIGAYSALVDVTTGQEFVIGFNKFKENIREIWRNYIVSIMIPLFFGLFFIFFLLQLFSLDKTFFLFFVHPHIDIFVLYLIIRLVYKKKYLIPFNLPKRKIAVNTRYVWMFLALQAINLILFYLAGYAKYFNYAFFTCITFLSQYAHFITFACMSFLVLKQYPEIEKKMNPEKQLFLVKFPDVGGVISVFYSVMRGIYPLDFIVRRALTPKGYKIREFNNIRWKKRYYRSGVLVNVVFGCSSSPFEAYKIAGEFRRRGARVVLSGMHATFLPDEALEYCDSVIIGEAEGVWKEVVRDYENNSLKKKYQGSLDEKCRREVHQELLRSPAYIIKSCLETNHGCKYQCDFCPIPVFCEGKARQKPVNEIVELIKKVRRKYRHISFIDENIYNDPQYAKKLFRALKTLRIKWSSFCSIDIAKNEDALQLAKESGCEMLIIGYEIAGDSPERMQGGKLMLAEEYVSLTKKIKKKGIYIKANFIFGFESDNLKSLFRLWKFCFVINPLITAVALLSPRPGTKFYSNLRRDDRIINLNWRSYEALKFVFKHKQLNNSLSSLFYPIIIIFFSFTTSKIGYLALIVLALVS